MTGNPLEIIREKLHKLKLDAVMLNTSEITPSVNLKYLSGFTGSDGTILITSDQQRLFTDGRYATQARAESGHFRIHVTRDKIRSLSKIIRVLEIRRLGVEGSRISFDFVDSIKKAVKNVNVISVGRKVLEKTRIIKNQKELERISLAARIASSACKELLQSKISGKTEIELAGNLRSLFEQNGASGESFETIVASGKRSALPHGRPTGKRIELGDLIVIDYGCAVSGYNSDETVTCVVGAASSDQKKIHQTVYDAHNRAIEFLKPGVRSDEVDRIARLTISEAGYGKYFVHSLGHGVGLEVHEPPYLSPRSKTHLEAGMVFTIEPGVYIEGFGGVRLESLVHITSSGPEILSTASKGLIEVA